MTAITQRPKQDSMQQEHMTAPPGGGNRPLPPCETESP